MTTITQLRAQAIVAQVEATAKTADALVALINQPRLPSRDAIYVELKKLVKLVDRAALKPQEFPSEFQPVHYLEIERAFEPFAQSDGPSMAYYEVMQGGVATDRYEYQSFRWQSDDIARLISRVEQFAMSLKSLGVMSIVWRSRPELVRSTKTGHYSFFCRLHAMPYQRLPGCADEGSMVQEA